MYKSAVPALHWSRLPFRVAEYEQSQSPESAHTARLSSGWESIYHGKRQEKVDWDISGKNETIKGKPKQ